MFNKEMNLVKALAMLAVVSGHLEFAVFGTIFPPYSYHLAIFFFVSGYFYNDKYELNFINFIKTKAKTLLKPYFVYAIFYAGITALAMKLTGQHLGNPYSLKEFFITPFLNGHQYNLFAPAWFIPQLFILLVVFFILIITLKKVYNNRYFHLVFFLILSLLAIPFAKIWTSPIGLMVVRTAFSLFFVYLGYFYKRFLEEKYADKIFNIKWLPWVFTLQAFLWITNKDFTPMDGIGLSYILVWGDFDDNVIPILTSLTGIWIVVFLAKLIADKVKDGSFLDLVGKNSYHIMVNHVLIFYLISLAFLTFNHKPLDVMEKYFYVYYVYEPLKYTFVYFVATMFLTTYMPEWMKKISGKINSRKSEEE